MGTKRDVVVLAVMFMAGCRCGGSAGAPVPLDQLPAAYVETVCRVLPECYGFEYCDLEHCRRSQTAAGYEALVAEIDAGWVTYDAVAAGACRQSFIDLPCRLSGQLFIPTVGRVLATCPGVLTGQRRGGQTCASTVDCAGGLQCTAHTNQCPGTCVPYAGLNESCADVSCQPDGGFICANGTCKLRGQPGLSCADTDRCYPILCGDAGTCIVLAEGHSCDSFGFRSGCAEGLFCDGFSTGVCRLERLGGRCWDDEDCLAPETCLPGDAGVFEAGGCGAKQQAGGRCDSFADCVEGTSCSMSTCLAPAREGEACDFSRRCAQGMGCVNARCAKLACPGSACSSTAQCAEATCRDGGCVALEPFKATFCAP